MTLNVLVPHTPLPYINIGYIMDVYSLLYTLYVIPPAILTLVIKLPSARLSRGDMGWTSCYTKQRINVCRLLCRTLRSEDHRLSYKIYKWISRRRKGWAFEVDKIVNTLKYLHALFCTDEMTLNVLVPHTPLPYINIGYKMDVYSLLYTLYIPCICLQPFGVKLRIE
jgi:hypothetical protein